MTNDKKWTEYSKIAIIDNVYLKYYSIAIRNIPNIFHIYYFLYWFIAMLSHKV